MIIVNIEKAKEIHRGHIRIARFPLLKQLDVEFQRALETGGDTSEIISKKNILRDATQTPEIESASNTQELKLTWDAILLGPSPYS